MTWNKFKSQGFKLADKFQKLEIREDVLESCIFPVLLYGAQTWSLMGKEKRTLRTCQQKMEWRIRHVLWSDRVMNAEIRNRTITKHIVAVTQSLVETGRPCDRN
jgi:hypothetical protein